MIIILFDRNQIQKCFLGEKSNSSTKEFFTSSSSDFEVEPELTKKEEKNVQPSALCESSAKSAVSSTSTVICTSDCASSQNTDACLQLPAKSKSTESAIPSLALVDDSLCTEQKEESSLQSTTLSDIESSTNVAASFFASISGSTSDVESLSMEDELPHMTICHRKRQTPLRHVVDRKKMRYDAAKEYLPEMGEIGQARNFVIINGLTNEAMEGKLNVAESIKALYNWIAGTIRPDNLPAQFGLVCMSTFHNMECTDLGCEHSYPLETGRTSSVALLPEVLVIKKIGDVLDGTLTAFDEVYFSL
ncbi:hypothetical protein CHS0354_037690 [Potamilus streckersoni]|uniref:Uncharacterized protein n=1 Tax=Potamilus streckersoni TaxID=2493646 RepID=A0AAE0T163_9BIVA|nr:hypothetical protein CHS0354_037690 [Potamilus streckersoni]